MKGGLWSRIKRIALTDVGVLVRGLDRDTVTAVERTLVEADFGAAGLELAEALEEGMRRGRFKSADAVREWLETRLVGYLRPDRPAPAGIPPAPGPEVVLVLGVNGVGKTTTVAKLAHRSLNEGRSVLVAAADTFRAGASEQLEEWAKRLGVPCVTGSSRSDPAAVAYEAVERARAANVDVVIVDTAGRLHTHGDLMEELRKIARVVGRRAPGAPHESLLVLDATVGQNALQQGRVFSTAVPVTGLVVTKLDGTARGGSVVRLVRELGIPIKYVGVGEGIADLEPFDARRFVTQLLAD